MSKLGKILGISFVFLILTISATVYFAINSAETPLPGFAQRDAPLISGDGFKPADIATIKIVTNATSMHLRRTNDGWTHATKDDYPVKDGLADELIERLTLARILYHKRVEQDDMQRFGLQAVTEPSSSATRVSFHDSQDDLILRVRIGHQMSLPGGSEVETLAALPAKRSIAVLDRNLRFPWTFESWLRSLDLPLSKRDVPRIEIGADLGGPKQIFRSTEEGVWLQVGQSGGKGVVENQSALESLASGLILLEPEDARRADLPAEEISWRGSIRLYTNAGALIDYNIVRTEDGIWSRVALKSGECDDENICDRLAQKIRAFDRWWLKIPIFTRSGIEVAARLTPD